MSYVIGFAGKGGTGKSTIASVVTRYIADKKKSPVLAIDADPNTSLGEMLGLDAEETIVGIIDDVSANLDKLSAGVAKERLIESRVQQALSEGEDLDLLVMGRPEGPGCYCYPNDLLKDIIGRLEKSYKYIVIDNEAGMEHLSRRTSRKIDYFFIISDATIHGVRSAKRILALANEMKISRGVNHLIVNKIKRPSSLLDKEIKKLNVEKTSFIQESEDVLELSGRGEPVSNLSEDTEFVKMIYKICEGAQWH